MSNGLALWFSGIRWIVNAKDADGRPLSEYARESGIPEIAQLFITPDARNTR